MWDDKWTAPRKTAVRASLKMSTAGLDKANVRILSEVKTRFPESVTHSVAEFACCLNDLAGLPLVTDEAATNAKLKVTK